MSITIEESRLVDNAAMQQHRTDTGYDYSKEVQIQIQALVESEITLREMSRTKPVLSLLPKPGIYNGSITVKKEDVIAYSKSHPQIDCKPSHRSRIIEILKSGASTVDMPKTKDQERARLSDSELSISGEEIKIKVIDLNTHEFIEGHTFTSMSEYTSWLERNKGRVASVNLCSDEEYDYELIGLPSQSGQSPDFVNKSATKDADLLISENATYYPPLPQANTHRTKVKTFARSTTGKSSDSIIGEVRDGTELKAIDCHVGPSANFAIVESEEFTQYGRFYINLNDVEMLEGVSEHPKDLNKEESKPDSSKVSIDWTTQSLNVPYYDSRVAKHRVVIPTGVKKLSNSQSELENVLIESFRKGASLILRNHGKNSTDEVISQYESSDFYDSPIRVVELFMDDRRESEMLALVECPHRNLVMAREATQEPFGYFVEDYDVSVFVEYINQLTSKIDSLGDVLDKFKGKIVTFVPEKESQNVSLLPSTIDEIFKQNGIDSDGIFSKKGLLTIRWDKDLKILGMKFEDQEGKTYKASKGLVSILGKPHMESKRTQNFLFNLNRICATGLEDSWTDFFQNFVSYDQVKVLPFAEDLPFSKAVEGPLIKTLDQLRSEEDFYLEPQRKINEFLKRENAVDFVGASALDPRNFESIKDKVSGSTKDAYKLFLNNVDFRKVVFKTVRGLVPQSARSHLDTIRREVDGIEFDVENYGKRIKTGIKDAVEKKFSNEIGQIRETQQEIQNGLDRLHKYQRDYQNLETTLGDLSSRQDEIYDEYSDVILEEAENIGTEIAEEFAESAEDTLVRQISETTGLEPNTIKGIKDKLPDLLGKKITFEEVSHFPEIVFKDDIPTDDISEFFVEELKNKASAMVNEMIKSLIKNTLDALTKATSESNRSNRQPESDFDLPGISIEPSSKNAAEEIFGAPAEKIENILDDTTNLLSPEELCALFDGKPTSSTSQIMKKVMRASYPELEMSTTSQVSDFFKSLADYTNFASCRDLIEAEIPDIFMDDFACPPNSSLREGILKEKGLSDEQIDKQLENERQRSRNLAEDLLAQLKDGPLSGGFEAPSDFCSKGGSASSSQGGQNSFMDDNFRYSLRTTLNKIFESVYSSFRSEGEQFSRSLFQEVQSERQHNDEAIKILERKPLPNFEQFLQNPDIDFLQQFRSTRITSPVQKLELGVDSLPAELLALETQSDSATVTLVELPSSGNEISHTLQMQGASYIVSTPVEESSGPYEFSSRGFLESMLVDSYKELTNIDASEERSLTDIMTEIHNEIKKKVFIKMFDKMSRSPYFRDLSDTENSEFLLDYVNLGPQVTPECDPHLLKVTDEVNEIFNKFKDDMCADNVQTPQGIKPTKTALESSMMSACVRITLRHYLIECLTRGLVSMSTITGSNSVSDLVLDYVATKLQEALDSYGRDYREDFYEQVKEIYSGTKTTTRGMITEMLREEYDNVSFFLYEALLLGDMSIRFKNQFFNGTPIIELISMIDGVKSNIEINPDTSPFVIVMEEDSSSLCIVVDSNVPRPSSIEGNYYKRLNLASDKQATLMPIAKLQDPTRNFNEIKRGLYRNEKTQKLLDICFPIDTYASAAHIHEMESCSKIESVVNAFGDTRDTLYSVFYTVLPQEDDWKKENKLLSSVGGGAGLTALWDFNFGVFDTPVTENTFNFGLPVPWGQSFKGLFFSFAAKAIKDAALKVYKESVEKSDLNISLASTISKRMKLVGVNLSTTEVSILLSALPLPGVNPYMMTPASIIYNALGLGSFIKSGILSEGSEEADRAREKIEGAGLKAPRYCREILLD